MKTELQTHWFDAIRKKSRLNNYYISGTTFTILNKSVGHCDSNNNNNLKHVFFCMSLLILQTSAEISGKNGDSSKRRFFFCCKWYTVDAVFQPIDNILVMWFVPSVPVMILKLTLTLISNLSCWSLWLSIQSLTIANTRRFS